MPVKNVKVHITTNTLKGLTIVKGLKNAGGTSYDSGSILDPQSGKTYKLKGSWQTVARNLSYVVSSA